MSEGDFSERKLSSNNLMALPGSLTGIRTHEELENFRQNRRERI
jgi:hypothetical protein